MVQARVSAYYFLVKFANWSEMPLAPLKDPWQQVPIVENESDEVCLPSEFVTDFDEIFDGDIFFVLFFSMREVLVPMMKQILKMERTLR